jgi:CheY-like chemotaxis protein
MHRKLRILVAEDDPDDQLLIREALKAAHIQHHVTFVSDGQELLEKMSREAERHLPINRLPDLILLDLNMPRMDGREALKRIKADPTLRRIPVVVFTTSTDRMDVVQAYETGSNAYIVKPETFTDLVSIMQSLDDYWSKVVNSPSS